MSSVQDVGFERVDDKTAIHADLIGAGGITVLDEGVRVVGRRSRRRLAIAIAAAIGVVTVLASILLLMALGWDEGLSNKGHFLVGFVFGIVPGMIAYQFLVVRLRGGPVDVVVPWSRLTLVSAEHGLLRIRFSTTELTGDIYARVSDPGLLPAVAATLSRASG